jgi:CheY-like chemotaxis protein
MELNNLPQDHQNSSKIRIAAFGFEADVVEKLNKIFQRERPGQRVYTTNFPYTGELVDIFLVNYDNPSALPEKDVALGQHPNTPIVAASQGALSDESIVHHLYPYQVHGILLAARILNVLDKVTNFASTTQPQSQVTKVQQIQAPVATPEPVKTSVNIEPVKSTASYRALVVDDSIAIQKSLELNLLTIKSIAEIDFADSGEIALEKIETKQYDIIFLDVMMPGIDGYETCTQIRKKPLYKKTPIVMVSAKCSPLDEVKGIVAGCTTYLTKPVQNEAFQKLSHRMMEWLANKKPPQ